ncbi:MAG: 3'-5' exonuclease [Balneolaceae bacterium]|nr:3'-5' exonuclease [Balneolaceae bacterium]
MKTLLLTKRLRAKVLINTIVLHEYGETHPPVRFRFFASQNKGDTSKTSLASLAAEDTAKEIKRLINDGKSEKITIGQSAVKAKDIAVLVRTHKQADLMREALQKKKIKSVQYSDKSVFKSDEAYYLETFLQAVAEPSNESLIKTALSLPLSSFTANDLLDIENDEKRWIEILDQFVHWNKQWHKHGFASMFRSLLQDAKISEHVINLPNGERVLTNILHLGELLQNRAQENGSSHHSLIKWLSRKRKEEGKKRDEEQLRLESDQELVKIVTMHRSKGLEYPIVFCPFLWYGPKYSDSGQPLVYHNEDQNAVLDLTGKKGDNRTENRFQSNLEDLAESLRLAYVAMTRAKQCLYLSWGYADLSEFSALGYLFQSPREVKESLRQKLGDGNYSKPDGSEIEEAIITLCEKYPQLFDSEMSLKGRSSQLDLLDGQSASNPITRKFQRETVDSGFIISSFSSLASSSEDDPDMPDYDQFVANRNVQEIASQDRSIFNFPRGPQPGTCIHKIFEEIDFQALTNLPALVNESLSTYGIDRSWQQVVTDNVKTVLDKNLLKEDASFSLSKLSQHDRIAELEFYFKSEEVKIVDLLSTIRQQDPATSNLEGHSESGFLKGFIDLTFQHDGKFYLLDYKTNYLGDSISEYSFEHMRDEIHHHMYDLQYHIYAIALHRFLGTQIPNYTYKSHFGGALYLFVRGINENGNEGIYFDRPQESVIEKLDSYLSGVDNG